MSQQFFLGEGIPRACSGSLTCCAGMAQSWLQHTLRGNITIDASAAWTPPMASAVTVINGSFQDSHAPPRCPSMRSVVECGKQHKWMWWCLLPAWQWCPVSLENVPLTNRISTFPVGRAPAFFCFGMVVRKQHFCFCKIVLCRVQQVLLKLTWLVLGGDLAARSHRVEQLTAL